MTLIQSFPTVKRLEATVLKTVCRLNKFYGRTYLTEMWMLFFTVRFPPFHYVAGG